MDPDNTLQAIRDIVEEALGSDGESDKILELAERFEALDVWMSRGGFLPRKWEVNRNAALPDGGRVNRACAIGARSCHEKKAAS